MKRAPKPPKNAAADRAVKCFNTLTHTKGPHAGEPFNLRPWQENGIVRPIFGTLLPNGLRQIRTALILLPRKNGKSELGAGFALQGLIADGEIGAEVYSAAADEAQAAIVYNVAAQMVRNDEELLDICTIIESKKRIVHRASGSFYQVLTSEAYSKHGFNASRIIADELHAWPGRKLWDVLTTSTGARDQPLVVVLTTVGFDRKSVLFQLYQYAKRIEKGIIKDPSFFSVIYEAPREADWTDERVWRAANPALGDFRNIEEMRIAVQQAKEMPDAENSFRQLYLNQWTQQATRAIPMHLWDQNHKHAIAPPAKRRCFGGLDLSAVSDITAWVLAFDCEEDPEAIDLLPRFWVPEARLTSGANADLYQRWAREGFLETTPGEAIDYAFIKAQVLKDAQRYNLIDLNVDRLFQGQQLAMELAEEGLQVIPMGQGFVSYAAPMVTFFRKLTARQIHHGAHPILLWMADNLVVRKDPAGNMKPDKDQSQDKIDGISASVMAIDRWERNRTTVPEPPNLVMA
jgi:phage terminase large subunit-like protein